MSENNDGIGFGLDFGTTNSVVALHDRGHVRPITDSGFPHPSVVWYRPEGQVTVGRSARDRFHEYSSVTGNRFVTSIKSHLGTDFAIDVFGSRRTPAQVARDILSFLRQHTMDREGLEIREAVMTIPVSFGGQERADLRRAAQDAGIFIKTFVHEPFAAVVAHYCGNGGLENLQEMEGQNILVFDWGGGTLDITVATVRDGNMQELATAALKNRAGDHFDQQVFKDSRARFLDQHELSPEEFELVQGTKDRYLTECTRVKLALSEGEREPLEVARAVQTTKGVLGVSQQITRTDFEALIEQDVRLAMHRVDEALEAARVNSRSIDQVLLIGGTSRVPLVRREMLGRFGARVIEVENADTIIAEGAATVSALGLEPVLTRDIGIRLADGTVYPVFEAGTLATPDACRQRVDMFCTDNRDGKARLMVVEGADGVWKSKVLVPVPVSRQRGLSGLEGVRVNFQLDDDLVLNVEGVGATQEKVARTKISDLCFGLRVRA